jgi:hypothetical protein
VQPQHSEPNRANNAHKAFLCARFARSQLAQIANDKKGAEAISAIRDPSALSAATTMSIVLGCIDTARRSKHFSLMAAASKLLLRLCRSRKGRVLFEATESCVQIVFDAAFSERVGEEAGEALLEQVEEIKGHVLHALSNVLVGDAPEGHESSQRKSCLKQIQAAGGGRMISLALDHGRREAGTPARHYADQAVLRFLTACVPVSAVVDIRTRDFLCGSEFLAPFTEIRNEACVQSLDEHSSVMLTRLLEMLDRVSHPLRPCLHVTPPHPSTRRSCTGKRRRRSSSSSWWGSAPSSSSMRTSRILRASSRWRRGTARTARRS